MPPKSSSDSSKKKKSGKVKGESTTADREREKEEEKRLAEEFVATPLGHRYAGFISDRDAAKAASSRLLTTPDNPPCDGCSTPFAGTKQCSRCESVFYCSRECQVSHWTAAGGHKTECKQLKKQNVETARRVLKDFFTKPSDWRFLDVAGAYNAAVHQGLHDKIREALTSDKAEFINRIQNGPVIISFAQCVMSGLFRGDRAEGKEGARSPDFTCVDGRRVKGYVLSHPEALDVWLQATLQTVRAATDPVTARDSYRHRAAYKLAMDAWGGWTVVFTCSTASRAVLSPFPSPNTDATDTVEQRRKRSEDHARRTFKVFAEAIRLVVSVSDDPRFESGLVELQGKVVHVAALVLCRAEEYGIRIDADRLLPLVGEMKEMFHHLALPVAKRITEKGEGLDEQEMYAIMNKSYRAMGYHERFAER